MLLLFCNCSIQTLVHFERYLKSVLYLNNQLSDKLFIQCQRNADYLQTSTSWVLLLFSCYLFWKYRPWLLQVDSVALQLRLFIPWSSSIWSRVIPAVRFRPALIFPLCIHFSSFRYPAVHKDFLEVFLFLNTGACDDNKGIAQLFGGLVAFQITWNMLSLAWFCTDCVP